MKKIMRTVYVLAIVCGWAGTAAAITREDVLDCGLSDGSKFILRSKFDWSMIPLPALHSSRETKRGAWGATYQGTDSQAVLIPASVDYSGKSTLTQTCAYFGMKNGIPMAPFSFRRADGSWYPAKSFPYEQLDISHFSLREGTAAHLTLQRAGIEDEAFNFGWIYPDGERLVYEKPLYKARFGYATPIDAVYQAWSSDGGSTWSEGRVTTDARIFELGRGWAEQSIRARPISLNGKNVP